MLGYDFSDKGSPYMQRRDRAFGRRGGRPTGSQLGGTGTTGTIGGQVTPPGGQTGTGSGISGSVQQSPYAGFLQSLTKPMGSPYKSQFKERAGLLREYTQGAYGTAAEGVREKMGARGIRPGESGIADTAIGRIQKAGAEELSRGYRGLAAEEGAREQEYKMGTMGMNLQRMLGGGGLALQGEEGALNRMMEYYRSKLGAETAEWQPYWSMPASGY